MSFIGKNISLNTLKQNGLSAAPTSPVEGMIYYDDGTTNTEGLYIYRDSAWEFVGTKIDSQKLNPLDADPGSPIQGQFFYSDGTSRSEGLYVYDGTQWKTVGSGSSGINYIENNDAEGGTTGWSTYNDSSEVPVDGTGGSASILFTASSSSPLRGTKSFLIEKNGAASRQGEGISYDFSIDDADKGQLAAVSFDYSVTADYSTDNIKVYLYDVTNSRLINLVEAGVEAKSPAGKYLGYATFSGGSTSYRVLVHIGSNDTDDYDIKIDNFRVGPAETSAIGDIGFHYVETFDGSSNGSTNNKIPTVDSFTEDGAGILEIESTSANGFSVTARKDCLVTATYTDAFSSLGYIGWSLNSNQLTTSIQSITQADRKALTYLTPINAGGSVTVSIPLKAGDVLRPHNDGASGAVGGVRRVISILAQPDLKASDSSGRTVYVLGRGSTTGSVTSDVTPIDFTNIIDTHAAWSSGTFTAPEGGIYSISSAVRLGTADDGNIDIYINGTRTQKIGLTIVESTTGEVGSATLQLQKGDELQLRKGSGNSSISDDAVNTWINITKIAELPDVIQPNFTKWQTKTLSSNVLSNVTDIVDLRFQNLVIGNTYKVTMNPYFSGSNGGGMLLEAVHNGSTIARARREGGPGDSGFEYSQFSRSHIFTATATTLTFNSTEFGPEGQILLGDTQVTLEELPAHTEVDTF
jgi:hypothetical protein